MKYFLLTIFLFKTYFCFSQLPLESKEYTVTKTGFIYYSNKNFVAFVAPKNEKANLQYDDFFTDSLGTAYYLPSFEGYPSLVINDIKKCERKFPLSEPWMNNDTLTIAPVQISFTVHSYAYREDQMKEITVNEVYKLKDKTINIISIFSIGLNVTLLKPICNLD